MRHIRFAGLTAVCAAVFSFSLFAVDLHDVTLWQPLHPEKMYGMRMTTDSAGWTASNMETSVTLDRGESISIANTRNTALKVLFHSVNDEEFDPESHTQSLLEARISQSPGLVKAESLSQSNTLFIPHSRDRLITITNAEHNEVVFSIYSGEVQRLQPFTPISWLAAEHADTIRIENNRNQHNDFAQLGDITEFDVDENKTYWLESFLSASDAFSNNRMHLQRATTDNADGQAIVQFEQTRRTEYFDSPLGNVRPTTSSQIKTHEETESLTLNSPKGALTRLQSLDEDWLFASNYEKYNLPAIERRNRIEDIKHTFWAHTQNAHAAKDYAKVSDPTLLNSENRIALAEQGIYVQDIKSELNNFTRWSAMKVSSAENMKKEWHKQQTYRWDFTKVKRVDYASSKVITLDAVKPREYLVLQQSSELQFNRPLSIADSEIEVEVAYSAESPAPFELFLKVDGREAHTFLGEDTTPFAELQRNMDWQIQGKTANVLKRATYRVHLPSNWQTLSLNSALSDVLVRINYRSLGARVIDDQQWQHWFTRRLAETDSPSPLEEHPRWLAYQHYMNYKQQQFNDSIDKLVWQPLAQWGAPVQGLLAQDIPESLKHYRIILEGFKKPRLNDWRYWQSIYQALVDSGWQGYGNQVLTALVMLNPDSKVVAYAVEQLAYHYTQNDNHSQLENLMAFVMAEARLEAPLKNYARAQLANAMLKQNRAEFALFILSDMPSSDLSLSLARKAARQSGLFEFENWLLESARHLSESESESESNNIADSIAPITTDDLSPGFLSKINAKTELTLQNKRLNVPLTAYKLDAAASVKLSLSNATRIELTARLWFPNEQSPNNAARPQDDWLRIRFDDQSYWVPLFYSDFRSENLFHEEGKVGAAHRAILHVPKAGEILVESTIGEIALQAQEVVPSSQVAVREGECLRENTQIFEDSYWWNASTNDQVTCRYQHVAPYQASEFRVEQVGHERPIDEEADFLSQLQSFESSPTLSGLVRLHQTLNTWPDNALKERFTRRLNKFSNWQQLSEPVKAKRFIFEEVSTNTAISSAGYRTRLLYLQNHPDWERVSTRSALNYELLMDSDKDYRLMLLSQPHLFEYGNTSQVAVSFDGELYKQEDLLMGQQISIPLPKVTGSHQLAVFHNDKSGLNSVLAQLQYKEQGEWRSQPQKLRLRLYQADQSQPLQYFLSEPSWLRVDKFDEDGYAGSTFHFTEQGYFDWVGEPGQTDDTGYRVSRLALQEPETVLSSSQTIVPALETEQFRAPFHQLDAKSDWQVPHISEQGHSWGIEIGKRQLNTPDEDNAQTNRFWEGKIYAQAADTLSRHYLRQELAVRRYDSDFNESYHVRVNWWDTEWAENWDLNLGGTLDLQQGISDDKWAGALRLHARTSWQYSINRRLFNRFEIEAWGRLIESGKLPENYATSVYSQFKLDHRYGVSISESLRYKFTHDAEGYLGLRLNSNPFDDSALLDNAVLNVGARFFYQGLSADIGWRYQQFVNDEDRLAHDNDSRIGVGLDWFHWNPKRHYRVRLGIDRNLLEDENYWYLQLSLNDSDKRGVKDYLPRSLSFQQFRHQQAVLSLMENSEDDAEVNR